MPKRNRRLRKKLYLDEFAVFGFEVSFDFARADNPEAVDQFLDRFIDFVEFHGLLIGGGFNEGASFFVVREGRYDSITQHDIEVLTLWLKNQEHVSKVNHSGLIDAYQPVG